LKARNATKIIRHLNNIRVHKMTPPRNVRLAKLPERRRRFYYSKRNVLVKFAQVCAKNGKISLLLKWEDFFKPNSNKKNISTTPTK